MRFVIILEDLYYIKMDLNSKITNKAALIWAIADKITGVYKPHEYGKVILPLTVIKRFDSILEETKSDVLAAFEKCRDMDNDIMRNEILTKASGHPFYNTSKYTLRTLLDDPDHIDDNFASYINAFSPNVCEIIEKFEFAKDELPKMREYGLLFTVLQEFGTEKADMHPSRVSDIEMGYIFEELIRKFSESYNEEAGQHYTPREVIELMVHILLNFDNAMLSSKEARTIYDPACGTGGAQVLMSVNAINGIKGGLGASYANGIIAEFSAEVSADSAPRPNPQKIEILSDFKFNPYLSSKAFMVPAILVFLISLIGGILAALNIVSEKELGTMEQMNVAPVSKTMFIASKLFPVWIIGMAILSAGIILAYAVYGLLPKGSFLLVYLFAAIYLTAFTAFGLVVSNISSSAQQAILVFIFFIMIFLLMSGIFTPLSSMPAWAQNMTLLNPMRYIVEAIRAIYLKGATFSDLLPQFLAICAFSIALNIYAVASFKRSSN